MAAAIELSAPLRYTGSQLFAVKVRFGGFGAGLGRFGRPLARTPDQPES
jgi:hypothetical protein